MNKSHLKTITGCDKLKLTPKWERDGTSLIVLFEVDKQQYHYYTERSFSRLDFTYTGKLQIFYLPMKNYDYEIYTNIFVEFLNIKTKLLDYECLETTNPFTL
jgi:hypothetical protein